MLNKLVQRIKTYEANKLGFKPIHISCGYYLRKNPQGLTAKELCDLSLEDKAAVSRALKTLQERGLVKYVSGGHNEKVQFTDEGRRISDYIAERIDLAVKSNYANLNDDERNFLYKTLMDIADNLTDYYKNLTKDEDETNE